MRDVDFDAGRVWIKHNEWRLLKRAWHERSVPLWPQLRETLEEHLQRWQPRTLLFPSHITGRMYTNLGDGLRLAFRRARILKKAALYICRHTYCSVRLQTLDAGQPVSPYTVAEELGHKDLSLIMSVYGHLQHDRRRLASVEYREATVTAIGQKKGA